MVATDMLMFVNFLLGFYFSHFCMIFFFFFFLMINFISTVNDIDFCTPRINVTDFAGKSFSVRE